MTTNTNISVSGILFIYLFISLAWYLAFSTIVLPVTWNISNIHYLMWSAIALSVICFCRYVEIYRASSFRKLLGNALDADNLPDLIGLNLTFIFLGIGSAALLVLIEASVDPASTINKWGFIAATEFSEIEWNYSWVIIMLLTSTIIIPVTEELIFRGLLLNSIAAKYNSQVAVLVSSFIFALFHINKSYPGSFLHGVLLALVAIKYASLYYPIIIHSVYNMFIFIAQKYSGLLFMVDTDRIGDLLYWAPEMVCLLIGLTLSGFYFRKLLN